MSELKKMLAGELYFSPDAELVELRKNARLLTEEYNKTSTIEEEKRKNIINKLFKSVGKNCYIEPSFKCDYGKNISVGDNFYANFDCVILDVNEVIIGNNCMLAPRVCIYTAYHPLDYQTRNKFLEYGSKIIIKNNVWIGGNAVILPGVCIGNNVVVAAGSVVTKDVPDNVVVAGVPAKIIKIIEQS